MSDEKYYCNSVWSHTEKLRFNAVAAIITRGLSEIIDLGVKMGAKKTTFMDYLGLVI